MDSTLSAKFFEKFLPFPANLHKLLWCFLPACPILKPCPGFEGKKTTRRFGMNKHENKFAALTEQELQEINGGGTWEPIYGWGENGLYGGLRYNK